jgi:hypothetical protein
MDKIRNFLIIFTLGLFFTESFIIHKKIESKTHVKKNSNKNEIVQDSVDYNTYQKIIDQLNKWHLEYKDITEISTYGKTSKGTECVYFRIGTKDKPKILIQSGIEGNEEFSILANILLIQKILSKYNQNEEIEWLVKNRDIYFIPVVSPDSYLKKENKRMNIFPVGTKYESSMPSSVRVLVDLTNNLKFKSVLSLHPYGESFTYPKNACVKDSGNICKVIEKMSSTNGFQIKKPINQINDDVNWFYSINACSVGVFIGQESKDYIVYSDIEPSVNQSFNSFILFIKESVEIDLNPQPLRPVYHQAD